MRQCPCGGIVRQWDVAGGERWQCSDCGRRDTVIKSLRQTLDPLDNMRPQTHALMPKGDEGSSLGVQPLVGVCISGADCHDETTRPVRAAIEKTDSFAHDQRERGSLDRGTATGMRESDAPLHASRRIYPSCALDFGSDRSATEAERPTGHPVQLCLITKEQQP